MSFIADYSHELICGMGGIIVTGVAAYIAVGQKLSFMSGQLTQLLKVEEKIGATTASVSVLGAQADKTRLDLNRLYERTRKLEELSLQPKSLHPK